jgi:hypothetical protein
MPEVNAQTYSSKAINTGLASSLSKLNNVDWQFAVTSYALNRDPEYYIYIYNVSQEKHPVSRPPIMKEMIIPARPDGKRYILVTRLPQPLLVPKGNVDSNEIDISQMDTRRFAMDIINPDNLGIDMDGAITGPGTSVNNDLGKKGVFFSLNGPGASKHGFSETPTDEEVNKAYKRMEGYYQFLLEQARTVEVSNPAKLSETLSPEHHIAADYFGEEHSWHGKRSRPADCPNCGARIKAGAAFHRTEEGTICVLDWKRTVAAGAKTRAQAFEATEDPQFAPKKGDAPKAE